MIKRRDENQQSGKPNGAAIEKFAAGADGGKPEIDLLPDPEAKHDYKMISVPFNKYEHTALVAAAQKTGRSRLNLIRWAILQMAEELDVLP